MWCRLGSGRNRARAGRGARSGRLRLPLASASREGRLELLSGRWCVVAINNSGVRLTRDRRHRRDTSRRVVTLKCLLGSKGQLTRRSLKLGGQLYHGLRRLAVVAIRRAIGTVGVHGYRHVDHGPSRHRVELVRLDAGANEQDEMREQHEDGEGDEGFLHVVGGGFVSHEDVTVVVEVEVVSKVVFSFEDAKENDDDDGVEPDDQVDADVRARVDATLGAAAGQAVGEELCGRPNEGTSGLYHALVSLAGGNERMAVERGLQLERTKVAVKPNSACPRSYPVDER